MPSRLKTQCQAHGCQVWAVGRYCDRHRSSGRSKLSPQELHNTRMRDRGRESAGKRGYDYRWQKLRKWHLARHPLCVRCLAEGKLNGEDVDVDHIVPIRRHPELRLQPSNLQTLCRRHHAQKGQEDINGQRPQADAD